MSTIDDIGSKFINVTVNGGLNINNYVDLLPGEILMWPSTMVDLDSNYFLECDGSSYSPGEYPILSDVIGTKYGYTSDGLFLVPNLNLDENNDETNYTWIRGEPNMDKNSSLNNTTEGGGNNSILNTQLPEHATQHSISINTYPNINVTEFDINGSLVDNETYYYRINETDGGTYEITSQFNPNRPNSVKSNYPTPYEHSHNIDYNTATNITTDTKITINGIQYNVSQVNSNVPEITTQNTQTYVAPSIKLKYYIFVGIDLVSVSSQSTAVGTYDTTNTSTTSKFGDMVTVNENLYVTSNEVIVKENKIIIYAGISPPDGYVWCDGENGTPDLRERFIASLDTSSHSSYIYSNNSGVKTNMITDIIPHTHTVTFDETLISSTSDTTLFTGTITGSVAYDIVHNTTGTFSGSNIKYGGNETGADSTHTHTITATSDNTSHVLDNSNITYNSVTIPNMSIDDVNSTIDLELDAENSYTQEEFVPKYTYIGFIMKVNVT